MRFIVYGCFLVVTTLSAWATSPTATERAQLKLESIKDNPLALMQFLEAMPKGADLHMHESGSSLAENMIDYAINDPLCLNRQNFLVYLNPTCPVYDIMQTAISDPTLRDNVIDSWSMRHFNRDGTISGHDHFFSTFGKYSAISGTYRGDILAEMTARAQKQHVRYLEIMLTPDRNSARILGQQVGYDPDLASLRQKLLAAGMSNIVTIISDSLDRDEEKKDTILACQNSAPKSGCDVVVRYIYQVGREQPPEIVFAQLVAGFESASHDPRVVGINMVQPEDGTIALRDYALHMKMIRFLHTFYPDIKISLHAGELTEALVSPDHLTFHIHDAITVAGASRIGHGVDICHETNARALLQEMAKKEILVEVNLSSNDYILNIKGEDHPLALYLKTGVPVALSTDDEGVSRENLTIQYRRAVEDNKLSYIELKKMARNSLYFAFISGENLWNNADYQAYNTACIKDNPESETESASCHLFLQNSPKANLQWQLEKQLVVFENRM